MTALIAVLDSPLLTSTILAVLGMLGHKVLGLAAVKNSSILQNADRAMRSVMQTIVAATAPNASLDQLHTELLGAAAIQLARVGLKPTDPLVKSLEDAAVTEFLSAFVVAQAKSGTSSAPAVAAVLATRAPATA